MQSTELNPVHTPVGVTPAALDAYVGRYLRDGGAYSDVARFGDALVIRHPALPQRALTPIGDDRFFDKAGTEYVFERDPEHHVVRVLMRARNGQQYRGIRTHRASTRDRRPG